jgi:hypothetical protein
MNFLFFFYHTSTQVYVIHFPKLLQVITAEGKSELSDTVALHGGKMLHNLCDTVALHQVTVLIPGRAHRTASVCAGGLPVRAQPTSRGSSCRTTAQGSRKMRSNIRSVTYKLSQCKYA